MHSINTLGFSKHSHGNSELHFGELVPDSYTFFIQSAFAPLKVRFRAGPSCLLFPKNRGFSCESHGTDLYEIVTL